MSDDHETRNAAQSDGDLGSDQDGVVALLRELTADDAQLTAPPADLWVGIEAEAALPSSPQSAGGGVLPAPGAAANVVQLGGRRRYSPLGGLAAAAAAAVVVAAGVLAFGLRDGGGSSVVATAELAYDAERFDALGADAAAAVQLVDDGGGAFHVEVASADLPNQLGADADLELWLIQPDAAGNPAALVSLGIIDASNPGAFDVPASYDPAEYFVVDISVEPRDGDETHSGRSILRGALITA